jgi:hypothetical protein
LLGYKFIARWAIVEKMKMPKINDLSVCLRKLEKKSTAM